MSTVVFDPQTLPELQEQKVQRPWRRKTPVFTASVVIASVVPFVVVAALFLTTDIPGALLMTVVYFPLQLIASAIAAVVTRGKRGILDSVIIVNAIGATIFSFVVLASVIGSLIIRGFAALSAHFLYQNSVYISPSTPLEYGGIGHAILGTVLIVTISALIAVPIGIATAVYITEVRGRAVPYVRFFVQAMSGVPSVVAGLFILTIIVATGAFEQGALAGGLAYAILMLPTVARTAEEVLKLVPEDLRTGALALGLDPSPHGLPGRAPRCQDRHHHRGDPRHRPRHRRDRAAAAGGRLRGLHQREPRGRPDRRDPDLHLQQRRPAVPGRRRPRLGVGARPDHPRRHPLHGCPHHRARPRRIQEVGSYRVNRRV